MWLSDEQVERIKTYIKKKWRKGIEERTKLRDFVFRLADADLIHFGQYEILNETIKDCIDKKGERFNIKQEDKS